MKNWDENKLQEYLDKQLKSNAPVNKEDFDAESAKDLAQYRQLYKILGTQPEIKLPGAFSQSVLNKINHAETRIWTTLWSVFGVIAALTAGAVIAFFVTRPYLNLSGLGDFFYKNILSSDFKNILGDLTVNFDFMLLGFGLASFITIILIDRLLKPKNHFRSS